MCGSSIYLRAFANLDAMDSAPWHEKPPSIIKIGKGVRRAPELSKPRDEEQAGEDSWKDGGPWVTQEDS